jgi:hypothetical protein
VHVEASGRRVEDHYDIGEIIATNTIQPDKTYWRNTMRAPGRWPGAPKQ